MTKKIDPTKVKNFVRKNAAKLLDRENITSVGLGYKEENGKVTKKVCIQFTVGKKIIGLEALEKLGLEPLPESFIVDGIEIPTDVIERDYELMPTSVSDLQKVDRKKKMDPVLPGASIGHPDISAGTAGCVVYDADSGEEYILSNWHVLNGSSGDIGDEIVQPGRYDDSRIKNNIAGRLVNSHIGLAGDCAIARIEDRALNPEIMELGAEVKDIAEPELGDTVVKSGRTTSVTYGIVSRIHVTVNINYGGLGLKKIGCFEYVPNPKYPPENGEVSMGGDSGSAVMLAKNSKSTNTILGLHFAGEVGDAKEHGLACYASSVFKKLNILPYQPTEKHIESNLSGFDWNFLSQRVRPPYPNSGEVMQNLLTVNNEKVFDYTHFSLVLDKNRKFASWVAWNIDGGNIKKVNRRGISFKKDPNIPADAQNGEEIYSSNPLDRGHIARRAELCWGSLEEAKRANRESFYFTNITPQHERFNQSNRSGIWGGLENAVFDGAKIENLKVNVMAGPIFNGNDPYYRGVQIPKEFWKVICYIDEDTTQLVYHTFILTQSDLISGLEGLDLDDYEIYKVPLIHISEKIGFKFTDLENAAPESIETESITLISSMEMVLNN